MGTKHMHRYNEKLYKQMNWWFCSHLNKNAWTTVIVLADRLLSQFILRRSCQRTETILPKSSDLRTVVNKEHWICNVMAKHKGRVLKLIYFDFRPNLIWFGASDQGPLDHWKDRSKPKWDFVKEFFLFLFVSLRFLFCPMEQKRKKRWEKLLIMTGGAWTHHTIWSRNEKADRK